MKFIFPFIVLIVFSCSNQPKENKKAAKSNKELVTLRKSDSTEVTNLVSDFFQAFDERDLEKMEQILTPTSKIIHNNGVTTDTKEMMKVINETKNWYPRKRNLSEFEFDADENFAIVGVLNEVTFSLPENKEVYEPYNETWIFKKVDNKWHPIRIHYSKIVREKHTEEVE
jgi:hypothetical protein